MDRSDPKRAQRFAGMDHGAHYLSCTWTVRVNGLRYRYKRASHGGPSSELLDPALCSAPTEAQAAADAVQAFTQACKDLRNGEYWGDFLEPL